MTTTPVPAASWPPETGHVSVEELDEFLADLYASRRTGLA